MASSNNYTLGRGEIYFARYRPGTQVPEGERYLGNTPAFNLTAEQETLDHYSSDNGVKVKDESVILQQDFMGSLTTDNIVPDNIALLFLGETVTATAAAATAVVDEFANVKPGRTYQLGTTDDSPTGVRMVENVVVAVASGTPPTLTAGADYVVDETLARVTVMEGGAIEEGMDLEITYDVVASTRERVISRTDQVQGALRYVAKNAAGDNIDYFMAWVKFMPNGDFALKGDEWQEIPFNVEILKKGNLEAIYADGRPYTPA